MGRSWAGTSGNFVRTLWWWLWKFWCKEGRLPNKLTRDCSHVVDPKVLLSNPSPIQKELDCRNGLQDGLVLLYSQRSPSSCKVGSDFDPIFFFRDNEVYRLTMLFYNWVPWLWSHSRTGLEGPVLHFWNWKSHNLFLVCNGLEHLIRLILRRSHGTNGLGKFK